jgi:phenylpropionate dioxygenase-like ring-hydroxylating dioxygenase large terminal subunit
VNDISASPLPIRSLEARYYTDPEIFRIERSGLLARTWQFAGHASLAEKPGDYFTFHYRRREPVLHSRPRW